jgi:hypothetical protein
LGEIFIRVAETLINRHSSRGQVIRFLQDDYVAEPVYGESYAAERVSMLAGQWIEEKDWVKAGGGPRVLKGGGGGG